MPLINPWYICINFQENICSCLMTTNRFDYKYKDRLSWLTLILRFVDQIILFEKVRRLHSRRLFLFFSFLLKQFPTFFFVLRYCRCIKFTPLVYLNAKVYLNVKLKENNGLFLLFRNSCVSKLKKWLFLKNRRRTKMTLSEEESHYIF